MKLSLVGLLAMQGLVLLAAPAALADDPSPLDLGQHWTEQHEKAGTTFSIAHPTPTSMTASFSGTGGAGCACGEERLHINLDRTYMCSEAEASFDYHQSAHLERDSGRPILAIVFCYGDFCGPIYSHTGEPGYSGYVGAEGDGPTRCLRDAEGAGYLPKPTLAEGANVVVARDLQAGVDGKCSGPFNAIEVHLRAAACDSAPRTISLANLRVRARPVATPPPSSVRADP